MGLKLKRALLVSRLIVLSLNTSSFCPTVNLQSGFRLSVSVLSLKHLWLHSQSAQLFPCLADGAARIDVFPTTLHAAAGIQTQISRVATTQDLLKDAQPTEPLHCGNIEREKTKFNFKQ